MAAVTHRQVRTNGIELHVAEAGPGDGRPVVLCHGFPELWYSWRHQVQALADAGFRVIAPDQRGYGESDRFDRVEDYGIAHLTDDLLGLLDDAGLQDAVFVGHDWGALITWAMARLHPERVQAMCALSVPLFDPPVAPIEAFTAAAGPEFYVVRFQEVGASESMMEADPRRLMRGMLGGVGPGDPLPDWLTEDDIEFYGAAFEKSGFFGPISYYRNVDANWRLMHPIPVETMRMPISFITGSGDFVHTSPWGTCTGTDLIGIPAMELLLPDFRGATVIDGAGHWNQQERPDETNDAILRFLAEA